MKPSFEMLISLQHNDGFWEKEAQPILSKYFINDDMNDVHILDILVKQ